MTKEDWIKFLRKEKRRIDKEHEVIFAKMDADDLAKNGAHEEDHEMY